MRNRLNTMELLMAPSNEDASVNQQSGSSANENNRSSLLASSTSPSRPRGPLPPHATGRAVAAAGRRVWRAALATAIAFRALLVLWAHFTARLLRRAVGGLIKTKESRGGQGSWEGSRRGSGIMSPAAGCYRYSSPEGGAGGGRGLAGKRGVVKSSSSSSSLPSSFVRSSPVSPPGALLQQSLESGYGGLEQGRAGGDGGDDDGGGGEHFWRETWRRHHAQQPQQERWQQQEQRQQQEQQKQQKRYHQPWEEEEEGQRQRRQQEQQQHHQQHEDQWQQQQKFQQRQRQQQQQQQQQEQQQQQHHQQQQQQQQQQPERGFDLLPPPPSSSAGSLQQRGAGEERADCREDINYNFNNRRATLLAARTSGDNENCTSSSIDSGRATAPASPVGTTVHDHAHHNKHNNCCSNGSMATAVLCTNENSSATPWAAAAAAAAAVVTMSAVGGEEGCCGLCGYTLEAGQAVVRSPGCAQGLMLHLRCFDESGVVFSDDADEGRLKFGCDCGQFHSGVGLTEGVYAFSSSPECALKPSASDWSSSLSGFPGGTVAVAMAAWGGRGAAFEAVASPRQRPRQQQARAASALESCPVFFQADPAALAIVGGEVRLRPVMEEQEEEGQGTAKLTAISVLRRNQLEPDDLSERFSRQDILSRAEAGELLRQGTEVLDREDNVLELEGETVVVGDLHGQFFDLRNLLLKHGKPPEHQYLFLGDYVDRGSFSSEVALYLIALKVAFPRRVYLIRGNHETANQTAACGFKDECLSKYGSEIYAKFLECFSALPVCAILSQEGQQKSLFCVHGGISPRLTTVADIRALERRVEPQDGTLLADLLWSDPSDDPSLVRRMVALRDPTRRTPPPPPPPPPSSPPRRCGAAPAGGEGESTINDNKADFFKPNLVRGCSWSYGWQAVDAFLKENDLRGILRAHSVQGEGFHHHFQGGDRPKSSIGEGVSTIFSAPMYRAHGNRGGVLVVRGDGGVDPLGYDAATEPASINSAQAAVRRACPYMPASLAEWVRLEGAQQHLLPSSSAPLAPPLASPLSGRWRQGSSSSSSSEGFDNNEALALRVLWEAMSGGGRTITVDSLFAFDDSFGDGVDCLHAAAALRALSPPPPTPPPRGTGGGGFAAEPAPVAPPGSATMEDFLRVAAALKHAAFSS